MSHFPIISFFFFSSRRRHTRWPRDWSSDVCSSALTATLNLGFDYSDVGNGRVRVPDNAAFEISSTNPMDPRGIRSDYDQRKENEILDFYLNYDRNFDSINSALDLTLGYSWEHHYSEG